jgi:hypothetical protein
MRAKSVLSYIKRYCWNCLHKYKETLKKQAGGGGVGLQAQIRTWGYPQMKQNADYYTT